MTNNENTLSEQKYRYCLADNDKSIIKHYTDKPLSSNAEKTLTILSEVFGGLHHLESDQLELFDYQSRFSNQYLLRGSLATWDFQQLTLLVIIAHDMAVRFEIQPTLLEQDDPYDRQYMINQIRELNLEHNYGLTIDKFLEEPQPYLRLLFSERTRDGGISKRHPTIEDTISGFRANNKRYA